MSDGHAERVPVSGPCGGCGDGQRDEAGGPWGSAHGAPEHSAVTQDMGPQCGARASRGAWRGFGSKGSQRCPMP